MVVVFFLSRLKYSYSKQTKKQRWTTPIFEIENGRLFQVLFFLTMPTSPAARTPRNNYAEPHTPIASAKRPRSMDKSMMSPGGQKGSLPVSPLIPMEESEDEVIHQTPPDRSQMSPMHPAKPLVIHEEDEEGAEGGRKNNDALFSPMLNFAGKEEGEEEGDHDGKAPASSTQEEEEEAEEYDEPKEDEATDEEGDDRHVEDDGSEESYEEDEFNPYVFIKSLPAYDLVAPLRPPIALPPKSPDAPPISLVLDLDETLVHCTVEPVDDADLVFPVDFHGMTYQVHVRLRPYLFEFLEKIKGKYEVIVFTASQKVYANELLNLIDPGNVLIVGVYFVIMIIHYLIYLFFLMFSLRGQVHSA